jgi:hypothetical protein
MLGVVLFDKSLVFDSSIYETLMGFRCSFLDNFFKAITWFGNPMTIIGLIVIFIAIFRNKDSLLLTISALDSVIVNSIIKHIVKRDRPNILRLVSESGYSFPSGHAMISVCVYGFLFYLAMVRIKNKYLRWVSCLILGFLILGIGISRIYVGVHYASDIIAGYALAGIEIILLIQCEDLIKLRGK